MPLVAAAALVAVGAVTVAIVRGEPELTLAGRSAAALAAELAAAVLLAAAALATWRASSVFAGLLVGTAIVWLVTEWNTPAAGPAFTPGLLLYAAWAPLLAVAALHGLDGQRVKRTGDAVVLGVAFGSGVGVLGVLGGRGGVRPGRTRVWRVSP